MDAAGAGGSAERELEVQHEDFAASGEGVRARRRISPQWGFLELLLETLEVQRRGKLRHRAAERIECGKRRRAIGERRGRRVPERARPERRRKCVRRAPGAQGDARGGVAQRTVLHAQVTDERDGALVRLARRGGLGPQLLERVAERAQAGVQRAHRAVPGFRRNARCSAVGRLWVAQAELFRRGGERMETRGGRHPHRMHTRTELCDEVICGQRRHVHGRRRHTRVEHAVRWRHGWSAAQGAVVTPK